MQKAWFITHENLRIERNFSYLVIKRQEMSNGYDEAVTIVPYVIFDEPTNF